MAEQISLGDLLFKLGFENSDDFLKALDGLLNEAGEKARSGGGAGGKGFGEEFKKGARNSAGGFSNDFIQSLGIQSLGTFLGQTLSNAFQSGLAAVQNFASQSNSEFKSYRLSINQAVAGGVTDLKAFEAQIKALSDASQSFSERDIALAVGKLVQQGYNAQSAFKLVAQSVDLARASINPATGELGDLADSGVKLSNVLEGFELPMAKAGYAADLLAKAAQNSGLEVNDLIGIVADVGSTAKSAGVSLEEVAASAGVLSQKGISAGEISTRIGTALSALVGPPQQVAKQFEALGISLIKADGSTRPFAEVLDNLNRVTSAGGRGLKFLNDALDTYQARALQSLGQSSSDIQKFAGSLQNADGSAKNLADTLTDGVQPTINYQREIANAQRAVGEGLDPVLLRLYKDILPPLIRVLEQATPLLSQFANSVDRYFQGEFKPGAKSALEAVYTDAVQADYALTRLDDNVKKRDGLKKLLTPVLPGTTLLPDQLALRAQSENALKETQAAIDRDKALLETLKRSNQKDPAASDGGTPAPTPKPTSNVPIPTNVGKARKEKDPLLEQAQELDKSLRLLELRYQEQKIPLEAYQGQLSKLEAQYTALGKKARTTDQNLAVEQGLSSIGKAREKFKDNADALKALQNQYDTGGISQEAYRGGLVKLLNTYEAQLGKLKAGSPEWQKLAAQVKTAGEEIGKLDKALVEAQKTGFSPQALFRQGERALPADTEQKAATAGAETGIAFRNAIDRVLLGRFTPADADIEALFDTITTAALNNVPRAKEALKQLEAAFANSGEIAGTGFVKALDKNLSFSDEQSRAEELARGIGKYFDLGTREGIENGLNALSKADLKGTQFYKNLEASLKDLLGQDALNQRAFEGKAAAQKILDDAANAPDRSRPTAPVNRADRFGETGAPSEGEPLNLDQGIADTVAQFEKLRTQYGENAKGSREFRDQAEGLVNTLYTLANIANRGGDVKLFEAASQAADGLSAKLNTILGLSKELDTDFKRSSADTQVFDGGDAVYTRLFDRIQTIKQALANPPDDPLGLEEFLSFMDDELFGALDDLDTVIAGLAPDDPELARFQLLRDLLGSIAQARAGITPVTVLADGTGVPQVTGNSGDLGGDAGGAGKKAGTEPPTTISPPPPPPPDLTPEQQQFGKDLGNTLTGIAGNFIRDLTDGTPDVGAALKRALGTASDFFLQQMLSGIIGPIAQELGKAAAGSLFGQGAGAAASLGPLGLIIGGGLLLGSLLFGGGSQSASQQAAQSSRSSSTGGASTINYTTELNFNVPFVGSLADPTFRAQLRDYVFSMLEEFERRKRPATAGGAV